jgi:hypothetical protein
MKEAPLRIAIYNGALNAASVNIVPALAGHKVRVYGVDINANAACNWLWYNSATVVKVWADMYGPASYGEAYNVQAPTDQFLFETANGAGLDFAAVAVVTVGGVCVRYAYIPI